MRGMRRIDTGGPRLAAFCAALLVLPVTFGCAGVHAPPATDGTGGNTGVQVGDDAGAADTRPRTDGGGITVDGEGTCKNLQCQQVACGNNPTTLTGTVYAPNGTLPLFNALVYVPNAPVPALPPGLACDRCGALPPGEPVVNALSDAHGVFVLKNVPAGQRIPLVIQMGKWRRQVIVPSITACQENRLTDPNLTRLPRNRTEGDMPRIAITTGACDNLICLIPKLGIDASEWGVAGEDKAVTFFQADDPMAFDTVGLSRYDAHLAQMTPASTLWGDLDELKKHDLAVFSCQCDEAPDDKGDAAYAAVTDYLSAGGRVFGTDFQYVWYKYSPDANLRNFAQIKGQPMVSTVIDTTAVTLDTTFPKGKALADWLTLVTPGLPYGTIESYVVYDNFVTVAQQPAAQVWGSSAPFTNPAEVHPRFITVNTPVGAAAGEQCGRAVHLDAHISPVMAQALMSFPRDCGSQLENGEQALAFLMFDVAACVQPDSAPIVPPIIP
jgi:hypothetical protein